VQLVAFQQLIFDGGGLDDHSSAMVIGSVNQADNAFSGTDHVTLVFFQAFRLLLDEFASSLHSRVAKNHQLFEG
jgi:hypothetical protein